MMLARPWQLMLMMFAHLAFNVEACFGFECSGPGRLMLMMFAHLAINVEGLGS